MDEFCGVEIMYGFGSLIDDVSFVLFSEHVLPDESVKIDIHELEEDIYISFIEGTDHLFQFYDVRVLELLQKHYLSVGTLGVRRILESIKIFLKRERLPRPLI